MFFTYSQNNSGGTFDIDHSSGITVYVIVEADSASDADRRAERIGLYFDGAGDCSCCGDRWSEQWSQDGDALPSVYGTPVWEISPSDYIVSRSGGDGAPHIYVHFKDGTISGVSSDGSKVYAVKVVKGIDGGYTFEPAALPGEGPKEIEA